MKPETRLLVQSLQACQQRVDKLVYSLGKNAEHLPATVETVAQWNEEQEDISDKSNRDKTLLMEKLGAIRSAEEFGTAAMFVQHHNSP